MANDVVSMRITGLSRVTNRLRRVDGDMQGRVLKSSMRRAMDVVKKDAIDFADRNDDPRTPLNIADHIILNTGTDKRTGNISARVGVRGGARYRRGDKDAGRVTYWRFVEFGTGRSRARPFMRPAMNNNVEVVFSTLVFELDRAISRSVA